jgi:hypothetical protein
MNKSNVLKYLVPIVAVVVLLESVLLIMNLRNRQTVTGGTENQVTVSPPVSNDQVSKPAVFDISIVSPSDSVKLGAAFPVEVKAVVNSARSLDSVNVYVKYNPSAFDITDLIFDSKLPKPTFSKASTLKGMVVVNFLISNPDGLKVSAKELLSLVKFTAKPKMTGNFSFEISTGNEAKESATMIVENATSEILPFTSSKLTVNVAR